MAVGDEAASAGLSVEAATGDIRQGYVAINRRGDELARHMTSGTHPFTRITGQVQTPQYADKSIGNSKMAANSISTPQLVAASVTEGKLATGSVSARTILNGNVTPEKLAKRVKAGTATLTGGQAGTVIETGLAGTVAMIITERAYTIGNTYAAIPQNSTGRFLVRYWSPEATSNPAINWLAMEV